MINQIQNYSHQGPFVLDAGGGHQPSSQYPFHGWSFPAAQEVVKKRKNYRFMGVSSGLLLVLLLLFLLLFVAMGFGTYQIFQMQRQLSRMAQVEPVREHSLAEKRFSLKNNNTGDKESKASRPAAHVIARIETREFPETLRWNSEIIPAFLTGSVSHHAKEGALQVTDAGLYHVYSRVELTLRHCTPLVFFRHSVLVKRAEQLSTIKVMEAKKVGFCLPQSHKPWTKESYLASAVQLQKNDKVFVNVSHPREVTHSQHANFFGLYKV